MPAVNYIIINELEMVIFFSLSCKAEYSSCNIPWLTYRTPASLLCWQLSLEVKIHCVILVSSPVHCESSILIGPVPIPKYAPDKAVAPGIEDKETHKKSIKSNGSTLYY